MSISSSSMSRSQLLVSDRPLVSEGSVKTNHSSVNESQKPPYQVDQQVKFLHLEAEIDSLLLQLQRLKQQRLAIDSKDVADNS